MFDISPSLTFRSHASSIEDRSSATLQKTLFMYLINKYISLYFLRLAVQSQFIPLQSVVYFTTLPFLVCKIFRVYINDVLNFKCPTTGPKG
jgi:hypothetical protein